jgi:hypothetical protein
MDRENHVSTKPVDRGMLKALCRYLDRFWRPEGEVPDRASCSEAPDTADLRDDMELRDDERRQYGVVREPSQEDAFARMFLVGAAPFVPSLESKLKKTEETCSERLLRMIRERGLEEVDVYTKACVNRKLFSKMRRKDYRPKAKTLYAFIIVLQLTLDDAVDLLASAGYAFSSANKLDIAVRYFIEQGISDLDEVNGVLYELGMETLP